MLAHTIAMKMENNSREYQCYRLLGSTKYLTLGMHFCQKKGKFKKKVYSGIKNALFLYRYQLFFDFFHVFFCKNANPKFENALLLVKNGLFNLGHLMHPPQKGLIVPNFFTEFIKVRSIP